MKAQRRNDDVERHRLSRHESVKVEACRIREPADQVDIKQPQACQRRAKYAWTGIQVRELKVRREGCFGRTILHFLVFEKYGNTIVNILIC